MAAKPRTVKSLAIVTPCLNEEDSIELFWDELAQVVGALDGYSFTVFFVDDGSTDDTWPKILQLTPEKRLIPRGIRLTRNFGHQSALLCGMTFAKDFDAVISLDVDLQDPPSVLPGMLEAWEQGAMVVTGVRESRPEQDSWLKTVASQFFYRLLGALSRRGKSTMSRDAGDFRLIDRKVLSDLLAFNDYDLYFRGMVPWLGYPEVTISYAREARQRGKTKFSFNRMLTFATGPLLQAVSRPIIGFLGAISALSVLGAAVIFVYVLVSLGSDELASGWASTVLVITFFGSLNLIGISLVGLLAVRVFLSQQNRPRFVVQETTVR